MSTLRIGGDACQDVGLLQPGTVNLVRFAAFHRFDELVGLRHLESCLEDGVVAQADALGFLLVADKLSAPAGCVAEDGYRGDDAARYVDVARDHENGGDSLACGQGFLGHVDREAPLQRCCFRLADHACGFDDVLFGNPRDLGYAADGVFGGACLELIESVAPLVDEVVVAEVFFEEDVEDAQGESGVGSGADSKVLSRIAREPGDFGVDVDDLGAALHHVNHPVPVPTFVVGDQGVVAPDHEDFGDLVCGVVVAVGPSLGCIGYHVRPRGQGHTGDARKEAGQAREDARVVRRTVRPGQACDCGADVASGALCEDYAFGAVLLFYVKELVGYVVEGFLPRHASPGVLAAVLRISHHGVGDALFMVRHFLDVQAAHAQAPLVERVFRIAFALDQFSVFVGVQEHAAAKVASRAGPRTSPCDGKTVFLVPPGFFVVYELEI